MDILARPADGCDISPGDFADITSVPCTSVDWAEGGKLRVVFEADLTPAEQQRVRLRITSSDGAEELMRVALAAYLTQDTPTNAQTVNTLKRAIRLLLALGDA